MYLRDLISGLDDLPKLRETMVFGVAQDPSKVRYGFAFFATHPHPCAIRRAVDRGAQAIFVPEALAHSHFGLTRYQFSKLIKVVQPDLHRLYANAAAHFPSRTLQVPRTLVGVTGTNGKTSSVCFLSDIWNAAGLDAMSLGTLGLRRRRVAHNTFWPSLTTFEPATLHAILTELALRHRITHLAMEVSSHALDQGRVDGLSFDAAIFTNLSHEHLDYHQSIERYWASKASLFQRHLKPGGTAIINIDDPHGADLTLKLRGDGCRVITTSGEGRPADLQILGREVSLSGQQLKLNLFGSVLHLFLPVVAAFQANNLLGALGAAVVTGVGLRTAIDSLDELTPVPGRCEFVGNARGAAIFVDYAHTPDALKWLLASLRPLATGRLHVVFGCGGNRDRTARTKMGAVAAALADKAWITDDNPETEPAGPIRAEVLAAASNGVDAGDRQLAIIQAIDALTPGDVLVIAGKGHEDYQKLPSATNPDVYEMHAFSDEDIARRHLRAIAAPL